ncbi:hypothetical protein KJ632_02940, partial [Patescibacteria group bacterium]|nr:hypothetical protein [Patescibacteria group bacterium]
MAEVKPRWGTDSDKFNALKFVSDETWRVLEDGMFDGESKPYVEENPIPIMLGDAADAVSSVLEEKGEPLKL